SAIGGAPSGKPSILMRPVFSSGKGRAGLTCARSGRNQSETSGAGSCGAFHLSSQVEGGCTVAARPAPEGAGFLDQSMMEIAVLALVAGFVLFRLYVTLGKRTGSERPVDPQPQPAQGPMPRAESAPRTSVPKASVTAGAEGLQAIARADSKFDPDHF